MEADGAAAPPSRDGLRVVLLARDRPEARHFANVLASSNSLAAIVTESKPITFPAARPRRPPLRSADGRRWAVGQLRRGRIGSLIGEPLRIIGGRLEGRLADVLERRWTAATADPATLFPESPPTFPADIPIHRVENLNEAGAVALLRSVAPDICVVVGTRVLSTDVIQIPRLGCVNWHPGILPGYRGVYCELFALYRNDLGQVGYTFHYLDAAVDTGDIIRQEHIPVSPHDDYISLRVKNAVAAAAALPGLLQSIAAGTAMRQQQRGPARQYFMRDVTARVKLKVLLDCWRRRHGLKRNTRQTPK